MPKITPLYNAIIGCHLDAILLLLKLGADPYTHSKYGCIVHHAISELPDHAPVDIILEYLMDYGMDLNKGDVDENYTMLHNAADGHEDSKVHIARALLNTGTINVNVLDWLKLTPLHRTVSACSPKVCKLLLDHGADTEIEDDEGNTPLLAAYSTDESWADYDIIKLLLDGGANVNATGILNNTLLHLVMTDECIEDKAPFIDLILSKEPDLQIKNESGQTVLELARSEKCDDIYIDMLVKYIAAKKGDSDHQTFNWRYDSNDSETSE